MLVNQTKNDLALNARIGKYMSRKFKLIFAAAIAPAILLLGVALLLLELFVFKEGDYFLSGFCIAFGVALFVFVLCFYDKLLRATNKKLMQGKETLVVYRFEEEGFVAEATATDGVCSATNLRYSALVRCAEYPDLFLLYYNRVNVFGVDKAGMQEGTSEELSALLQQNLGKKYSRRRG